MKYHLLGQRPSLEVSVTSVGVVCVTVSPEENFSHLVRDLVGEESRKQSIHGLNSCKCQFVSVTPSITDKTGQKPQLGSLILPAEYQALFAAYFHPLHIAEGMTTALFLK